MEKQNWLKRLDRIVLIHYPDVWATRVHWVIVLAAPIYLLSGLALAYFPFTFLQLLEIKMFGIIALNFTVLAFLYYAYRQRKLHTLKEFTQRVKPSSERTYNNFSVLFLSVAVIVFFPYYISSFWLTRLDVFISDEVLAQDVNALTHGAPFLEEGEFYLEKYENRNLAFLPSIISYRIIECGTAEAERQRNEETQNVETPKRYIEESDTDDYTKITRYYFGESDYIQTGTLEARTINANYGLSGIIKFQNLDHALRRPMTTDEALKRIASYLTVYKKYGYPLNLSPEAVLSANLSLAMYKQAPDKRFAAIDNEQKSNFQSLRRLLPDHNLDAKQAALKEKIIAIQNAKNYFYLFQSEGNSLFAISLYYTFLCSYALFMLNLASLRNAFWAVGVIAAFVIVMFVSKSLAISLWAIACFAIWFIAGTFMTAVSVLKKYSNGHEIALLSFSLGVPICGGILTPDNSLAWAAWIYCIGSGLAIPYFESLFIRLKSLPEK